MHHDVGLEVLLAVGVEPDEHRVGHFQAVTASALLEPLLHDHFVVELLQNSIQPEF